MGQAIGSRAPSGGQRSTGAVSRQTERPSPSPKASERPAPKAAEKPASSPKVAEKPAPAPSSPAAIKANPGVVFEPTKPQQPQAPKPVQPAQTAKPVQPAQTVQTPQPVQQPVPNKDRDRPAPISPASIKANPAVVFEPTKPQSVSNNNPPSYNDKGQKVGGSPQTTTQQQKPATQNSATTTNSIYSMSSNWGYTPPAQETKQMKLEKVELAASSDSFKNNVKNTANAVAHPVEKIIKPLNEQLKKESAEINSRAVPRNGLDPRIAAAQKDIHVDQEIYKIKRAIDTYKKASDEGKATIRGNISGNLLAEGMKATVTGSIIKGTGSVISTAVNSDKFAYAVSSFKEVHVDMYNNVKSKLNIQPKLKLVTSEGQLFPGTNEHTKPMGVSSNIKHATIADIGENKPAKKIVTDGSHLEDGKLKPDVTYKTGEHEYIYKTDSKGRIEKFETESLQLTERENRLNHNPNTPGKLETDHAGHLAGDRFGGSPDIDNLVSQLSTVNQSQYKKIENQWATAIKEGKNVTIDLEVKYDGSNLRPSEFVVNYTIEGKSFVKNIDN